MMAESKTPLRRLKRAVEKVKLLVSSNLAQWLYNSGAGAGRWRQLSSEEPRGLLGVISVTGSDEFYNANSSFCSSRASSPVASALERTMSSVWHEISMKRSTAWEELRTASSSSSLGADDVNNRTENFIALFRRHLETERQISLELRYCKSNSFEAAAAPPPPPLLM